MTIKEAASDVLNAMQSGLLAAVEEPLRQLDKMVSRPALNSDLAATLAILQESRRALFAHRAQIVNSLEQLNRSLLYEPGANRPAASWEIAA